jgi:hypothetical protein
LLGCFKKDFHCGKARQRTSFTRGTARLILSMEIAETGFLEEHGVKLLGTDTVLLFGRGQAII